MNSSSNYGNPGNAQRSGVSLHKFDFDLGIGSNKPRSLNDQKNKPAPYSYTPSMAQQKPAWQPNKPSWTHQPAPSQTARPGALNGPTSMVGDIFGKTWGSSTSGPTVGLVAKDPSLFGDLVNSALGQGKNNSNGPLKNSNSVSATSVKSAFSMGNFADSLPKQPSSAQSSGRWETNDSFGSFASGNATKNVNLGSQSMKNTGSGAVGMNSNKDPFSNFVGLGSKQPGATLNSTSKGGHDSFADFVNAPAKPSPSTTLPSSGFAESKSGYSTKMGNFGTPAMKFDQPPAQSFDSLFSSPSVGGSSAVSEEGQQSLDDWGFRDNDDGSATTELEGLPPPPAGVSASAAKSKGMENHKQGQYPDAIKWLSWAEILVSKSGDTAAATEVLTCRASCYKEVGEYKKAVADCTKVYI